MISDTDRAMKQKLSCCGIILVVRESFTEKIFLDWEPYDKLPQSFPGTAFQGEGLVQGLWGEPQVWGV